MTFRCRRSSLSSTGRRSSAPGSCAGDSRKSSTSRAQRSCTTTRASWYAKDETLSTEELIAEKYRGIRPAPGYPAAPDHTEKGTLFSLLGAERIGIELTENFAMTPAASVSGLYFAHPESKYFAVGRIGRDQVVEYHARKDMPIGVVERWLAPAL